MSDDQVDDKAAEQIRRFLPQAPLTLGLGRTGHPAQPRFDAFARRLAELNPAIRWEETDGLDLPGFILKANVRYSALPLERELAPFIKGLTCLGQPDLPPDLQGRLDRIALPCQLTLFIALSCPHCPAMVEALIPLAAACERIHLHIIDGSLFPQKAEQDKVMSAPCLILDNGFRWTGVVPVSEIVDMILNRDPARLSVATLKNILENGDADWIASEMIRSEKIFEGFIGLLLHETWSVRLGAMVVVETLAATAPDLGKKLIPILQDAFPGKALPVQGDILYTLGELGDGDTAGWINRNVGEDAHEELKDAAIEAVESIGARMGR